MRPPRFATIGGTWLQGTFVLIVGRGAGKMYQIGDDGFLV